MKITTHYGPCQHCGGTGKVYNGASTSPTMQCQVCYGSGRVVTGRTEETDTFGVHG